MATRKKAATKGKRGTETPEKARRAALDAKALVKRAYERMSARLEKDEGDGKLIDDVVKLVKLEKDLGEEDSGVKEIKVRWEPSEDESSNEK